MSTHSSGDIPLLLHVLLLYTYSNIHDGIWVPETIYAWPLIHTSPSHALESYTALPYKQRTPCPQDPIHRPTYQGSNPISDIWSIHALRMIRAHFKRQAIHVYYQGCVLIQNLGGAAPHQVCPPKKNKTILRCSVLSF